MPISLPEILSSRGRERSRQEVVPLVEVGPGRIELPAETKELVEEIAGPGEVIPPVVDGGKIWAAPSQEQLVMPLSRQHFLEGLKSAPEYAKAWLSRLVERLQKIAQLKNWIIFWPSNAR